MAWILLIFVTIIFISKKFSYLSPSFLVKSSISPFISCMFGFCKDFRLKSFIWFTYIMYNIYVYIYIYIYIYIYSIYLYIHIYKLTITLVALHFGLVIYIFEMRQLSMKINTCFLIGLCFSDEETLHAIISQ